MPALRWSLSSSPRGQRPRRARSPRVEAVEARALLSTLTLPNTEAPTFEATFTMNVPGGGPILVTGRPVSGGNFLGKLDNVPLLHTYCVIIDQNIHTNTTYANASATRDGRTYGAAVPNAGAVAWLMRNIAPTATSVVQQAALQAAIWRAEYGAGFELDGVDNENGAPAFNTAIAATYQADLAALGTNTALVDSVLWVSPGPNPGLPPSQGQGIVAIPGDPPVPATPPRVRSVGVAARTRQGITSLNVTFDKAMNTTSVRNTGRYQVLGGVTRGGRTTFPTKLAIRSVAYNSRNNTATITLARPYSGPVQLTVKNGILAANGAATTGAFVKVVR